MMLLLWSTLFSYFCPYLNRCTHKCISDVIKSHILLKQSHSDNHKKHCEVSMKSLSPLGFWIFSTWTEGPSLALGGGEAIPRFQHQIVLRNCSSPAKNMHETKDPSVVNLYFIMMR